MSNKNGYRNYSCKCRHSNRKISLDLTSLTNLKMYNGAVLPNQV